MRSRQEKEIPPEPYARQQNMSNVFDPSTEATCGQSQPVIYHTNHRRGDAFRCPRVSFIVFCDEIVYIVADAGARRR